MSAPNFDRIAHAYRWLEYATLGPLLERTRNHYLSELGGCRNALILGDGDGRFTARLLGRHVHLHAQAVDVSGKMLELLARRANASRARLAVSRADAREFVPAGHPDLVCTHFFLDCLTQPETDSLIARLAPNLAPECLWVVSDFRVPGGLLNLPARAYIRSLYFAFRVLTGLKTHHLPDFAAPLAGCGFRSIAEHRTLFGMLTTQLWRRDNPAAVQAVQTCMEIEKLAGPNDEGEEQPPHCAEDAQPDPEPAAPSLEEPDAGVYHHDPVQPESPRKR